MEDGMFPKKILAFAGAIKNKQRIKNYPLLVLNLK
jgi:hypothetical protein